MPLEEIDPRVALPYMRWNRYFEDFLDILTNGEDMDRVLTAFETVPREAVGSVFWVHKYIPL
jgi:hypothetical protein